MNTRGTNSHPVLLCSALEPLLEWIEQKQVELYQEELKTKNRKHLQQFAPPPRTSKRKADGS